MAAEVCAHGLIDPRRDRDKGCGTWAYGEKLSARELRSRYTIGETFLVHSRIWETEMRCGHLYS